jgi:hypothetical protein
MVVAILVLEAMGRVKRRRRESADEGGGRRMRCTCPTQQLEKHVETPSLDIEFVCGQV